MKAIAGIFLALAVMFTHGICPCGLALRVQGLLTPLSLEHRVAACNDPVGCPMCRHDRHPSDPRDDQPFPNRCLQTVSGDVPAPVINAPAHDLNLLPAFAAQRSLIQLEVCQLRRLAPLYRSFPPPTLVGLSCCLNI